LTTVHLVYVLGLHPCSIARLAGMRGLSLPAIHKHLKVLEGAGMIRRHKRGRATYLTLNRQSLQELQDWVAQFHPYWGSDEATLENYDGYLGITRDPTTEVPDDPKDAT
jgi:DNA-binding transcriptional ArsR family regulator